jgi:hypothetical protein
MKKALLLVLLLVASGTAKEKAVNLVPNGGFESDINGWMFLKNSKCASTEVQKKTRKEGKHAQRIIKTGACAWTCSAPRSRTSCPGHA